MKTKFILLILAIGLSLAAIAFFSSKETSFVLLDASELAVHPDKYDGDNLRVRGMVKIGSVTREGREAKFIIELNNKTDYVLSDIARIVEGNDAHILSLYFNVEPDSGKHAVTIKVDSTEIKHIVATFERYQYQVKAYFQESDMVEIIKDRYDSLMNYLNI